MEHLCIEISIGKPRNVITYLFSVKGHTASLRTNEMEIEGTRSF